MRKEIKSLAVAVLGLAAVACASPEKMAEMAESVTVTCDPSPLEVVAGKIDATVSVTYPRDYFIQRLFSRLLQFSFTTEVRLK